VAAVHVGHDDVLGFRDPTVETDWGPIGLTKEVLERCLCDSHLEISIDVDGRPFLSVPARHRFFSAKQLRIMRNRSAGMCEFPSCTRRHRLHGHHIEFWPDGDTTIDNGALLCPFHHGLVHEGGWKLTGTARTGLRVFTPDGDEWQNPDRPWL